MADVDLTVDPTAVARLVRDPSGPVVRWLLVLGDRVKDRAKRQVGVYNGRTLTPRRRRPGTLRDSIVKRWGFTGSSFRVLVGSPDEIAWLHHEGTPPHIIRPRSKPRLVFYWQKIGRVVAFAFVHHPGTAPNPYLTDSLRAVIPRS